jgi:hypothetical protein
VVEREEELQKRGEQVRLHSAPTVRVVEQLT